MSNTPKLLSVPVRRPDWKKITKTLEDAHKFTTAINKFNNLKLSEDSPAVQLQRRLEEVVQLTQSYK